MGFLKLVVLVAILLFTACLATPVSASTTNQDCGESIQVVRGDTLNKIAKRCGTTVSALMMANPQLKRPNLIYAGTTLQLPGKVVQAGPESSPTWVIRPDTDQISSDQIAGLGIPADSRQRWIDVDLSSQTVAAYEGHEMVRTFLASTGTWRTPTLIGQFAVYRKFETKDMRGPGYFLQDVPYTMFFHKGYALHGTFWHNNFGVPMSHGCVNLATEDAAWLFDFAEVDTLVNVRH